VSSLKRLRGDGVSETQDSINSTDVLKGFYINLPIGGLSGGIIFLFFTTPSQAKPVEAPLLEKLLQMDLPGTFTVMAGTVCYILALQWGGQTKPWSSSDVIGVLVGFGLFIILFVVIEFYQGERGIIVGRLLKDRTISVGMAYIFFLAGAFFLLLYYIPIYFQVVDAVSASESGIRNLPLILGVTITTILSGGLISAYGHFVPFMIFGSVLTTIGCGLLYTLSTTSGHSMWIGYQALAGLGIGLALQVPVISAQAVVAPTDLSSVTAMILCLSPTQPRCSPHLPYHKLIRPSSLPNDRRGVLRLRGCNSFLQHPNPKTPHQRPIRKPRHRRCDRCHRAEERVSG